MPRQPNASAAPELEDGLRAYFEATSGAHDPVEARLAALAGGDLDAAEAAATLASLGAEERAAWEADMRVIDAVWEAPGARGDARALGPVRRARRRRLAAVGGVALVTAAAAVALLVTRPAQEGPAEVRFKGEGIAHAQPDWALRVGVQRGERRFVLGPGGTLEAGDRIGFFYSAAAPAYLALAYVDADGEVVRLFPRGQGEAARVGAGRDQRLDGGATVTAAEGCEWVVAAVGPAPFDVEAFLRDLAAARAAARPCNLDLSDRPDRQHRALLIRR